MPQRPTTPLISAGYPAQIPPAQAPHSTMPRISPGPPEAATPPANDPAELATAIRTLVVLIARLAAREARAIPDPKGEDLTDEQTAQP